MIDSPTVEPAKLVPPPLGKMETLCLLAVSTTAITSSSFLGKTTPNGSI